MAVMPPIAALRQVRHEGKRQPCNTRAVLAMDVCGPRNPDEPLRERHRAPAGPEAAHLRKLILASGGLR